MNDRVARPGREEQRLKRVDLLTRLLHRRPSEPLRFPEAEEARFQRGQMPHRVKALVLAALLAPPLYLLTSAGDAVFNRGVMVQTAIARGVAIGCCVAIALLMRDHRLQRRVEAATLITALTLSGCQVFIARINPPDLQPIHWLVSLLLITYVATVIQVRFSLTVALAVVIYVQTMTGMFLLGGLSPAVNGYIALFMFCGVVIALVSNFMNERGRRLRYLQRTLLSLHRQGLYREMDRLEQGLGIDDLTGVGNRRGLEDFLRRTFQGMAPGNDLPEQSPLREKARQATDLGLILLGIDHFHAFTNHYGQAEGEFCLASIARHLQKAVGGHGNYLARFGDEQFAVVLPGATVFDTRAAAERLRRDVESLGLPHDASPTSPVVTVSVGISHTSELDEPGHQSLIEAADRNLFRARQAGGNRCHYREFTATTP